MTPKPNLDDYVTVAERVAQFYAKHPEGSLSAEIVHDDGKRVVMKACAQRSPDDIAPGVGHAEEIRGEGMVNKTSALENCETSAWGRAIAALGFEVKKGIASREEVEQALAEEERQRSVPVVVDPEASPSVGGIPPAKSNGEPTKVSAGKALAPALRVRIKDLGLDVPEVKMKLTALGVEKLDDLNAQQAADFEEWLGGKADEVLAEAEKALS